MSIVLGAHILLCVIEPEFLEKFSSDKNDPKWSKMAQKQGFWTFTENHVISFVWNLCKTKVIMVHWHSAKTACFGKIWFTSYSQKWLLANEIFVFLSRKYFISKLISGFLACKQTWMKGTRLINKFPEKKFHLGKWAILGQKMEHPHNCGSAVRTF